MFVCVCGGGRHRGIWCEIIIAVFYAHASYSMLGSSTPRSISTLCKLHRQYTPLSDRFYFDELCVVLHAYYTDGYTDVHLW